VNTRSKAEFPKAQAYSTTMHIMSGLLLIGLLCNLAVREVNSRYYNHENPPGNLAGARVRS